MKSRDKKAIAVLLLFTGMLAVSYPFLPYPRQMRNLRLADKHAPRVRALLLLDDRFRELRVEHFTGAGGCLWVLGDIEDEQDIIALMKLVQTTKPPVNVQYNLRVGEDEEQFGIRVDSSLP